MVCKSIDTCELKLSLEDFTNICIVINSDQSGCPDGFTHKKTPVDWRYYFKITYNELYGTEY